MEVTMKSASKILFSVMLVLPLVGCRTPAADGGSAVRDAGDYPTAFNVEGKTITCEPRDPETICAAVMPSLNRDFKNACDLAGGETIYCGECGFEQACTASAPAVAYNKSGEKITCGPRDPRVMCAAVMPSVDEAFAESCQESGGQVKWCGACGFTQACSEGTGRKTAYDKSGRRGTCEPRNPRV